MYIGVVFFKRFRNFLGLTPSNYEKWSKRRALNFQQPLTGPSFSAKCQFCMEAQIFNLLQFRWKFYEALITNLESDSQNYLALAMFSDKNSTFSCITRYSGNSFESMTLCNFENLTSGKMHANFHWKQSKLKIWAPNEILTFC